MKKGNRRRNVSEELERAERALAAADLLARNDLNADAVSRLYYHVYHHVRAALLSRSLEPKTHEGMLRLFSLHFVKKGPLETRDAHALSRLMKYRQEADYNPSYVFTDEDFREFRREAEELCGRIRRLLEGEGYV